MEELKLQEEETPRETPKEEEKETPEDTELS
jgi:hypothetical protein